MSESRGVSLGRRGEADWAHSSAAYRLRPDKGITAVFADSAEVRGEVRRRLESLAPALARLEPGLDLLERIHVLVTDSTQPPVAWIEAEHSPDPEQAWREGLIALNRGRDRIWDRGPVFVVIAGPLALNEATRTRAPDLSSVVEPVLLLDDTLEPLVESSAPLCWLQLSDLHVRSEDWQQDIVLRALARDLPGLLAQVEREPQMLLVTGDVAHGGLPSEYEGAFRLLDDLCAALGLDREQHLFMVPGNHDVDRGSISKNAALLTRAFDGMNEDEFRTAIGDLIGAPADFELFGRRLSAWCQFTARLLGPARHVSTDQPWRSDVIELGGVAVGVASICSAWMSGPGDAKDRLVVGQRQVQMLVDELASAGADLRIALIHHPVAWLREVEERAIENLLHDEFDVVLHGHAHHPKAGTFVHGRRSTVVIGAGAAYAGIGHDRFHGFTVAQIDPEREQIEIDAFTWTSRNEHWHIDAGFHKDAPRGRLRLPLGLARLGAAKTRPAKPEELAARLRRAVVSVHGSQGFIGLPDDAPKPKASLHDMFVPLELRAQGSGESEPRKLAALTRAWLRAYAEGERAPRVVVLGDPGSGKTTLCRYLAVSAAEAEAGLCPLLLSVRDWKTDGAREALLDHAQRYAAATLSIRTNVDALAELCEQGRVILLVDGVDETGVRQREALRDRVQSFAARYPRVPIVVTSRVVGYDEAPLDHRQFERLTLEPLNDPQLREFIRRWYAVAQPDNPSERRRREAELWAALRAEPRAMQLARNPLLATLLALVHFHRMELPGGRALLYRLCIETLVVTWPTAAGRELPELPGYRQLPLLEDLALWMQSQRSDIDPLDLDEVGIVVTGEQLRERLRRLLEVPFQDLDEGRRRDLAETWRRWLIRASGLIQERQSDRYGFLHLSLMEHLAGQAVWREQVRHGHDAVVRFVVEHHADASWRETLLLMLGNHGSDRALGDAVVRALLEVEPRSWDARMFALSLLREELEIDPGLLNQLLDAVVDAALDQGVGEWAEAGGYLADVLGSARRLHHDKVRAWFEAAATVRSGKALVAVLAVFPWELDAPAAMASRGDDELEITALLDLAALPWGHWAAKRAKPSAWLQWAQDTPLEGILMHSLASVLSGHGPASVWVGGVLRRALWMGSCIRDAARTMRSDESPELPIGVVWKPGGIRCQVAPAIVPASHSPSQRRMSLDFGRYYQSQNLLYWGRLFPLHWTDIPFDPGAPLERYFEQDFAQKFVVSFAGRAIPHLARSLTFARPALDPLIAEFRALMRGHKHGTGDEIEILPAEHPPTPARSPLEQDVEGDARSTVIAVIADAHAGLLLAPAGQPAAHIAAARVQNRWIHSFFDHLVTHATNSAPLTPEQHALFLALGLAQYQTTWSWPPGLQWRSWFISSPPEHWLAAYVWHLCWVVGEPDNPEHRVRAAACLHRGDWPEFVAELRTLEIGPPSAEILALFDGWRT